MKQKPVGTGWPLTFHFSKGDTEYGVKTAAMAAKGDERGTMHYVRPSSWQVQIQQAMPDVPGQAERSGKSAAQEEALS